VTEELPQLVVGIPSWSALRIDIADDTPIGRLAILDILAAQWSCCHSAECSLADSREL